MLTLQLNLENEQGLQTGFDKLFDSLSIEDKKDIAKSALLQYLTSTVDYDKVRYQQQIIDSTRINGIKDGNSSWNQITVDQAKELTDEQLLNNSIVKAKIDSYKTPKESRFDEIFNILKTELEKETKTFIETNGELKSIVDEARTKIIENFPNMTTTIMSSLVQTLFLQVIQTTTMSVPIHEATLNTVINQLNQR